MVRGSVGERRTRQASLAWFRFRISNGGYWRPCSSGPASTAPRTSSPSPTFFCGEEAKFGAVQAETGVFGIAPVPDNGSSIASLTLHPYPIQDPPARSARHMTSRTNSHLPVVLLASVAVMYGAVAAILVSGATRQDSTATQDTAFHQVDVIYGYCYAEVRPVGYTATLVYTNAFLDPSFGEADHSYFDDIWGYFISDYRRGAAATLGTAVRLTDGPECLVIFDTRSEAQDAVDRLVRLAVRQSINTHLVPAPSWVPQQSSGNDSRPSSSVSPS